VRPKKIQKANVSIIAEVGVNHNGDLELALRSIEEAAEAGADYVKFQFFSADALTTKSAPKARYQETVGSESSGQQEMLRELELSKVEQEKIWKKCQSMDVLPMASAFDVVNLANLVCELDAAVLKIPSGEITNGPFIYEHATSGRPIILSTGMANDKEITQALWVLGLGYLKGDPKSEVPTSYGAFSDDIKKCLEDHVTLLHCTTEYPTPYVEANISAIQSMAQTYGLAVGYSDHTIGEVAGIMAVALGASVIEKHFTLDRELDGPDHKASMEPREFQRYVRLIRCAEECRGDGIKQAQPSEISNKPIARRSVVASKKIAKGEKFTENNVTTKRPGNGLTPMKYWELLETVAQKAYEPDDVIELF
jgi:N-acetylneuraminate synthase